MARLTFPDEGSRLVYRTVGDSLRSAAGAVASVYVDDTATTLADIRTVDGSAVPGSVLTVDAHSRIPLFQGPDGADTVWVVVAGGPATPVYARVDDRIDALEAGGGPGTPGASAYEVAVENGFVGTETQWLASLVGPQGPAGDGSFVAVPESDTSPGTVGEISWDTGHVYVCVAPDTWKRVALSADTWTPPTDPGDVIATQVFTDTFDTYAGPNLPSTPWTLRPDTGIWRVDATADVAWANGSACNAVRDTGSRDHRILAHLKTSITPCVGGVVCRYKDEQNYVSFEYVFTTTEPHAWSFFIKANNVGREIKFPSSAPFVVDQDHTVQVDCVGDVITVTENGTLWESPVTLTTTEAAALGATATWAGMINFSGRGNFYDVTGYTLTSP